MSRIRSFFPGFGAVRRRWWWLGILVCMTGPLGAQATREYDLKAVFLFNFATFVDWPKEALPENAPFVIGVFGEDPFGRALDEVIVGEKIRGMPLQVKRCATIEEAKRCHILFISASAADRVTAVLQGVRGMPVLTVADMPRFVEGGGMIAFTTDSRVQLRINPAAAQRVGLVISSKLLRVAKVVEEKSAP
jgi:hypothetical protein